MSNRSSTRQVAMIEGLENRQLLSTVVAVTGRDTLIFFDSATPDVSLGKVRVRGMQRRESLVGIDFRPATGQLYGLGDTGRLYLINATTGSATAVSSTGLPTDPPISGTEFGFDFNPSVDRIRVVSDADQNLRLNPDDASVVDFDTITPGTQTDLALAYVTGDASFGTNPNIGGVAYTNNVAGGTPTTLFGIDVDRDALVRIGSAGGTPDSPNAGGLTTIGSLNMDIVGSVGFDIETITTGLTTTNTAYVAVATNPRGRSELHTINLDTGATTLVGAIRGSKRPVRDIAVVPTGNTLLAVDKKNRLFTLDSNLTTVVRNRISITGLARRERVMDIDVRPANNTVYAWTNQNRLYALNPTTGVATVVGESGVTLNRRGVSGIDFNPAVDRLRVVNSVGENLRIDPNNGQAVDADLALDGVQFDTPLVYATGDVSATRAPTITGVAYTNSITPAPTDTTLYAIDSAADALVTIGSVGGTTSPNLGQLFTVGSLGLDVREPVGFDIASSTTDDGLGGTTTTNSGYAVFRARGSKTSLYEINLTTGAAANAGQLARGVSPVAFAILPAVSVTSPT